MGKRKKRLELNNNRELVSIHCPYCGVKVESLALECIYCGNLEKSENEDFPRIFERTETETIKTILNFREYGGFW